MGVCVPAGLGMPWNPLARAGGNVQVKGSWVSLLRLLHLRKYVLHFKSVLVWFRSKVALVSERRLVVRAFVVRRIICYFVLALKTNSLPVVTYH